VAVPIPVPSVRDVADGVKLIGDVVKSTRLIVEAINDGKKYLKRKAPDTERYWAELMQQMQFTVQGLAEVTGVVSGFSFGFGVAGAKESDLSRFNDYVIAQRAKVTELRGRIRQLRGSSGEVQKLREILNDYTGKPGWSSMWGLLGKEGRRKAEPLASLLGNFYADDHRLVVTIETMVRLAEFAVSDVEAALGPPGRKYASNIPTAAELLGVYATIFAEPQQRLDELVLTIEETRAKFSAA